MDDSGGPRVAHRATARLARVMGWRRRRTQVEDTACPTTGVLIGPFSALTMSLWFGLCAGLMELGLTLVQKPLHDPSPGFFRMNRQIVWTIPTFNLALFGLVGLVLVLVLAVRVRPQRSVRLCAGTLGML